MKKQNSITLHPSGSKIRFHNKSIHFKQLKDKSFAFIMKIVDKEADVPATKHECLRGKVRVTYTRLSEESFEGLIQAYIEWKKRTQAVTPK